jgi:HEPN domain-containing protein/predicted nucleotidyltransferase
MKRSSQEYVVTLKDAKQAASSISKKLDPFSVVLFGSVAREGQGHDLDLLVVIDDSRKTTDDVNLLLHQCLKPYYRKFSVDSFVVPLSLLREYYVKGSPFLYLVSREGRPLYMKDIIGEWCKQAEDELGMAEYLLQGTYFKGACYHAQQSSEKAMKARLLRKGWGLEKTHSIERLVAIGKDYKVKFPLSDDEIVFMDHIYKGRYPIEAGLLPLGEPSREDAGRAVAIADRLLKNAKRCGRKA